MHVVTLICYYRIPGFDLLADRPRTLITSMFGAKEVVTRQTKRSSSDGIFGCRPQLEIISLREKHPPLRAGFLPQL